MEKLILELSKEKRMTKKKKIKKVFIGWANAGWEKLINRKHIDKEIGWYFWEHKWDMIIRSCLKIWKKNNPELYKASKANARKKIKITIEEMD